MREVLPDGTRGRDEPVPAPFAIPLGQGFSAQLFHPIHPVVHGPRLSTFGHLALASGLVGILVGWLVPPFGFVVGALATATGAEAVRRAQRFGHLGLFLGLSTLALASVVWYYVW